MKCAYLKIYYQGLFKLFYTFHYPYTRAGIILKRKNCINFVNMKKGYFQNRLFNMKQLNIELIRNGEQVLKNIRDFLCFKMNVLSRLS